MDKRLQTKGLAVHVSRNVTLTQIVPDGDNERYYVGGREVLLERPSSPVTITYVANPPDENSDILEEEGLRSTEAIRKAIYGCINRKRYLLAMNRRGFVIWRARRTRSEEHISEIDDYAPTTEEHHISVQFFRYKNKKMVERRRRRVV